MIYENHEKGCAILLGIAELIVGSINMVIGLIMLVHLLKNDKKESNHPDQG